MMTVLQRVFSGLTHQSSMADAHTDSPARADSISFFLLLFVLVIILFIELNYTAKFLCLMLF